MTNPSNAVLQQVGVNPTAFSISSRYYGIATAEFQNPDGDSIVFLRRRFIPPSESFFVLQEHTIVEGERLDNITNQYYGDPERFWQICDSNNIMDPETVTEEPGTTINITLPQGVPGSNA
jgi:nucleoid-associated protein YgaU